MNIFKLLFYLSVMISFYIFQNSTSAKPNQNPRSKCSYNEAEFASGPIHPKSIHGRTSRRNVWKTWSTKQKKFFAL